MWSTWLRVSNENLIGCLLRKVVNSREHSGRLPLIATTVKAAISSRTSNGSALDKCAGVQPTISNMHQTSEGSVIDTRSM